MREFTPLDKALRLKSERLLLRPITEEDTDMVLSWRNSDFVRNCYFYRALISREEHLKWLHEKCEKGLVFQFVVEILKTGEPIGSVYLQHYNEKEDSFESGVFFSPNAPEGEGYASEAVALMNKFAFEELKVSKTIAKVVSTNRASIRLHEKVGFCKVQQSMERIIPNGNEVLAITFELANDYIKGDKR